jgi:hypothetical protein
MPPPTRRCILGADERASVNRDEILNGVHRPHASSGRSPFGQHVHYFSPALGYLAGLLWGHHAERDLARTDFQVSLGSLEAQYDDREQGWVIVIGTCDTLV